MQPVRGSLDGRLPHAWGPAQRLLAAAIVLVVTGCGVPQDQHDAALARVDSLESELDELRHGASRLLAGAELAFESGNYTAVLTASRDLVERHPDAPEVPTVTALAERAQERIDEVEREEAQQREAEERERERQREELERRRRAAVASLWSRTDEVEGITWFFDRESSRYVNSGSRVVLYMGRRGEGKPWLLFSVRYTADDWLFIQSYTFNVDGRNYRISASGFGDVERDNGYGGIWEWYTTTAGTRELEIARAIANSTNAVVRYNGRQYHRDRTITNAEKQGLQKVLDAFAALGG